MEEDKVVVIGRGRSMPLLMPLIITDLSANNDVSATAKKFNIDEGFVKHVYEAAVKTNFASAIANRDEIVKDCKDGMSVNDISKKYNIDRNVIAPIVQFEKSRINVEEVTTETMGKKAKVKHEKRKAKAKIKERKRDIEEIVAEDEEINREFEEETEDDVQFIDISEDDEFTSENEEVLNNEVEDPIPDNSDESCSFTDEWYKYFGLHLFEDKIKPYKDTNVVVAGLVAERHRLPVDKCIFEESFSEELMFDYDKQEEICRKFIMNNIPFEDNKPKKKLVVYLTGIQCALGSICKVCFDMHIDLTLKHFNASSARYYSQTIIGDADGMYDGSFYKLRKDSKKGIYFYDCDQSKFGTDCDELYTIKLSAYSDDESYCTSAYVITDTYNKVWELYPSIINYINANDGIKLAIFVTKSKIIDNNFIWGAGISKGFNFK